MLLSVGSHSIEKTLFSHKDCKTEQDFLDDLTHARGLLKDSLEKDAYLAEKAPGLLLFKDIDCAQVEDCRTVAEVQAKQAELEGALKDVKTVLGALRRTMKALFGMGWGGHGKGGRRGGSRHQRYASIQIQILEVFHFIWIIPEFVSSDSTCNPTIMPETRLTLRLLDLNV